MTVSQVKAKCLDLKYNDNGYFEAPRLAFYYLYRNEIKPDERPDHLLDLVRVPSAYEERDITVYNPVYAKDSNNPAYIDKFYFIDNKLIAVELFFSKEEHVRDELAKQYGEAKPIHHTYGTLSWDAAAWHDSRNRFIVWHTEYSVDEYVTYIDGRWLTPLMDSAISYFREQRESAKSLLDF
jgi:hypothetical protein